jgi:hypothetical protein
MESNLLTYFTSRNRKWYYLFGKQALITNDWGQILCPPFRISAIPSQLNPKAHAIKVNLVKMRGKNKTKISITASHMHLCFLLLNI